MSDIESRYRRAEAVSRIAAEQKVRNGLVVPHWIDASTFWYEHEFADRRELHLVDAERRSNVVAFKHEALASSLREAGTPRV